ncbi:hypothetical protein BGZ80_001872 [Entomortierella chlamydospora]|uniref:Uncharacterized protein n=1 Tax=Entomortierella chlamydospora TaxID=101097 RepID=A0A9P6T399_9FUNG|nr:hypothetical protein BGZ79_001508 [Entomortierella chlamydospora]KAG0021708.1 hypothetical protein BGZ80_001872 [Entomortierella chlamydospora]
MEGNRRSPYRNLQPRAAAAIDFNDSDDDDGLLSSDYKAQRKTTMDLVDFFKNAPPPPPPAPSLPPVAVEEKKKKTLLQRLRARKSSVSSNKDRSSVVSAQLPQGATSSISAISASSRGGEVATLPNGTKYVMIAVDYKSKDTDVVGGGNTVPSALPTSVSLPPVQGSPNRLNINSPVESKRNPILNNNPNLHMTTTVQEDNNNFSSNNDSSKGADRRRSIIIQAGGGEGSTFSLDNTPFLLDNFALNTDYITPSASADNTQDQRLPNGQSNSEVNGGHSRQGTENGSKRGNKVTFNIDGQHRTEAMNDDTISKALADRVANHKAQLSNGMLSEATTITNHSSYQDQSNGPEVILPRPVSRKKVRHVQIQTQHCIMRPMYTQTEPIDSLNQDLEAREFGTQTGFESNIDGFTDVGTSTDSEATAVSPTNDRLASGVASLTVGTTSTNTSSKSTSTATTTSTAEATNTTPLTSQEREELIQLRQQNAALQAQVVSLQRDLAAETRARTRTAVAMQDTRDKFEMLSAMAYKKLKEMITNRHILEMEVRELRAQVDMQVEEGEMYSQQQGQQGYITVGLRY